MLGNITKPFSLLHVDNDKNKLILHFFAAGGEFGGEYYTEYGSIVPPDLMG